MPATRETPVDVHGKEMAVGKREEVGGGGGGATDFFSFYIEMALNGIRNK